ncbi:MAG: hypothetical protein ACFFD6_05850 [Candidatus Thorarchaeota archaeon]
MGLFTQHETQSILEKFREIDGSILITFRNRHGPTKLAKLWTELVSLLGHQGKCINWWSSSGNMGLLECEVGHNFIIFGQWVLADENELIEVFPIDDDEIVNIRDGFDAGNVVASEMRALRIGETGDRD